MPAASIQHEYDRQPDREEVPRPFQRGQNNTSSGIPSLLGTLCSGARTHELGVPVPERVLVGPQCCPGGVQKGRLLAERRG
eukprot:5462926-Alexandrium_andersonii.AAC.1